MSPHIRVSDKKRIAIKADGSRIPVVDSKYSFLIDPTECMYCKACKRQFNSELVFVTRGLAYVELKGKNGKPELRRFVLTKAAKENIRRFDAGNDQVTPEAVIFAAPTGSKSLSYQSSRSGKPKPKPALIKGRKGGKPREKIGIPVGIALREKQTGRFQFAQT